MLPGQSLSKGNRRNSDEDEITVCEEQKPLLPKYLGSKQQQKVVLSSNPLAFAAPILQPSEKQGLRPPPVEHPEKNKRGRTWKQLLFHSALVFAVMFTKTIEPIVVAYSRTPSGDFAYNVSTVVIFVEIAKGLFSMVALTVQWFMEKKPQRRAELINFSWTNFSHYVVPSIMYAIANTLMFIVLQFINPGLYHILANMKILTTGILFRYVLGRPLKDLQWIALLLLTLGTAVSMPEIRQLRSFIKSGVFYGCVLCFIQCIASSFASVYTEAHFKKNGRQSIHFQNLQMYFWGTVVNTVYICSRDWKWLSEHSVFEGYNERVILTLVVECAVGISLSFIFKFLDNIVYVFSLTLSMFATAIISIWLFDFHMESLFIVALFVVTISTYLYYYEAIKKYLAMTAAQREAEEEQKRKNILEAYGSGFAGWLYGEYNTRTRNSVNAGSGLEYASAGRNPLMGPSAAGAYPTKGGAPKGVAETGHTGGVRFSGKGVDDVDSLRSDITNYYTVDPYDNPDALRSHYQTVHSSSHAASSAYASTIGPRSTEQHLYTSTALPGAHSQSNYTSTLSSSSAYKSSYSTSHSSLNSSHSSSAPSAPSSRYSSANPAAGTGINNYGSVQPATHLPNFGLNLVQEEKEEEVEEACSTGTTGRESEWDREEERQLQRNRRLDYFSTIQNSEDKEEGRPFAAA